jgi:hypothetical protein
MILIGTAGRARAGKDTVADYLVRAYGFTKFAFSDALYREVRDAFGIDEEWLRDADTKDRAMFDLVPNRCNDLVFTAILLDYLHSKYPGVPEKELPAYPLSPRVTLQLWGTEYRRAQDPDYWIKRAADWLKEHVALGHTRFVNTALRFANERAFIDNCGGSVWHVRRSNLPGMDNAGHASETPLAIEPRDFVIFNESSIAALESKVDVAVCTLIRRAA